MESFRKEYSINGQNYKKKLFDQLINFEKILITGASGWLGRTLINILLQVLEDEFKNKLEENKNLFIK